MEESLGTGANMNMNEGAPNQQQQQQQPQQQAQQTVYQQYPSVPLYPVTATTGTAPVATNAVQATATAYTAPATTTAAAQPYPGYYPATTTTTANNTGSTALPIWPTAGGAIAPYPVATATATNPYAAAQATTAAAAGTSITATNPYNAAQQTTAVTPYPSTTAARQSAKAAAAAYKAQQQQPGQRTVTTGYARNASARSPAQQSKHEAARQYALDANNATTTANNTTAVRSPPTARAPPAANNTTTATATTATAAHHRQYDPYAYHYSYYYQYFSTQPRPKGYEGQWPPPPLPGFDYASPGYQQQLQQQQQQQQPTTTATKTAQNNNTTGKRASLSPKPRPTTTARPTNITTQQPPNNNNINNKTASPPKMASPSRKETRKSTHKKDEEEDETAAAMDVTVGLLTRKFCSLIHASITGTIDLNEAAIQLGIQKKQVQEIADALEGIGLLEKRAKNTVVWKGALGASTAMTSSSNAANKPTEQDAHLKVAMERVRAKVDHYYREEAMLDCWISTLQSQMKQDEEDASKHLVQTGEGEHEHMPLNFVMSKDIIEAMYYPIQPIKPPKDATLIVKRPNTSKEPQSAIVAVHAPDGSLAEVSADTNNPNQPFPFQLSISQKSDLQKMVDRKHKAEANGEVVDPKRQHNSIEDGTNNNNNPIEVYLMPVEYNSKLDKMISSGAKVLPTSQMARQQEEETEMILSGQGPPEEEETTFTSPTLLPQEGVADFFHF